MQEQDGNAQNYVLTISIQKYPINDSINSFKDAYTSTYVDMCP